jgi:hypothetical protein
VAEGFLDDDEFGGLQGLVDQGLVGHRLGRVGAGDPHRLDLARLERPEQFDGALARLVGTLSTPHRAATSARCSGWPCPVGRQQVGEAAHFAAAHGVGLAGEREGAGARAADLAGGQVQVDQRRVVVGAEAVLVEPWQYIDSVAGEVAKICAACSMALRRGRRSWPPWPVYSRTIFLRASKPSVWASM